MLSKYMAKLCQSKCPKKKIFYMLIYVVYLFVLLEVSMRLTGFIFTQTRLRNINIDSDLKILSIGESTTFGFGVKANDAYSKKLEEILNNKLDKEIIVINKGVPGETSTSIIRNLDRYMLEYKPDLVISLVGINDLDTALNGLNAGLLQNYNFSNFISNLRTYKLSMVLIDYFNNYKFFNWHHIKTYNSWILFHAEQNDRRIDYSRLPSLELNYNYIINRIRSYGSDIIILSYLNQYDELQKTFRKISSINNVLYFELNYQADNEVIYIEDKFHPNRLGHKIMAEKIYEQLIKANFFENINN